MFQPARGKGLLMERDGSAAPMTETHNGDIVILTGAGISQESGLDTFRDEGGLWSKVRIEDVATPEAYTRDPVRVLEFYNMRRQRLAKGGIEPNDAHRALARLEADWPGEVFLVTQNIDNLHEKAGSRNLLHMHGDLLKIRCRSCAGIFQWEDDVTVNHVCDGCGEPGGLRPHVVWFGEMPLDMERIFQALDRCSLFISIGTSGNVYPAAGFVSHVRSKPGTHTVELNLEPSEGASSFQEKIYGPATEVVPAFVEKILGGGG